MRHPLCGAARVHLPRRAVSSWAPQHPTAEGSDVPELLDVGQAQPGSRLDCGVGSARAEADGPVNPEADTLLWRDAWWCPGFFPWSWGRFLVSASEGLCGAVTTSWGRCEAP